MRFVSPFAVPALLLLTRCTPFTAAATDGGDDGATTVTPPTSDGGVLAKTGTCNSLHGAEPALPSGYYDLDLDGAGPLGEGRFYCDMTTHNGGWTLLARSVDGAPEGAFGWRHARGDVQDDAQPYSLGADEASFRIPFTEILFGARGDGKQWGSQVYKHLVPAGFVDAHGMKTFKPSGGAITVAGACKPSGGPTMIGLVGLTDLRDIYFFGDDADTPSFGLRGDGWNTNQAFATSQNLCSYTAAIGGMQGMIFVR